MADQPAPTGALDDWHKTIVWFDRGCCLLVAVTVANVLTTRPPTGVLLPVLACAGAIVAGWFLLGRKASLNDGGHPAEGWAYVLILVVATAIASRMSGAADTLQIVPMVQVWMLFDRRRESLTAAALVLAGSGVSIFFRWGADPAYLGRLAGSLGTMFLFTGGIGFFVAFIMKQSQRNADLVAELQAAQAKLAASQHAAGVAAERERVAREIHDTLAQGFMSMITQVQVTAAAVGRDDAAVRDRLALMETTARENLAEARGLVAAFAPLPLQDGSLVDALRRLTERWSAETGLTAVIEADDAGSLAPAQEVVLLRAEQEALTNVRRHAGAAAVWVTLEGGGGLPARLEVVDDGVGVGSAEPGYGLRGAGLRAPRDARAGGVGGRNVDRDRRRRGRHGAHRGPARC